METKELLKKVRQLEIRTRGLVNQVFSGEYHSVFKGRGMAFSEVREYQLGDDVRAGAAPHPAAGHQLVAAVGTALAAAAGGDHQGSPAAPTSRWRALQRWLATMACPACRHWGLG